jgi:hypothetical protein
METFLTIIAVWLMLNMTILGVRLYVTSDRHRLAKRRTAVKSQHSNA